MEVITNNNELLYNRSKGSEVCEFYEGKNIFVTGGTGFMGKILIEKLLRTTNVSSIYMLIRNKKGKDVYQRMDEIFDDVIFNRLKEECPKFRHKLIGLGGDVSMPGLGLSIQDRQIIQTTVNVVFHVAATVRFDEKLNLAYDINVRGTSDLFDLCKEILNLKALVHVSTAYSNCHLKVIDEIFYDYPTDLSSLANALRNMSDEEIEAETPRLIGEWPNTYTFTKALAEKEVRKKCIGMPVGIFRPAVVISTYNEPIQGWIDNLYGPTGVCAGAAAGILRTLHADSKVIANMVPVDMCVAALICSAWDVAKREQDRIPENVPIYNYVSSTDNPITWGEFNTLNQMYGVQYPLNNLVWSVNFRATPNRHVNWFYKIALHYIPAVLVDSALMLTLQRPRMLTIYKKIHKFSDVISFFSVRDWTFSNDNTKKLWSKLNARDRELFPMNIKDLCWMRYFQMYLYGVRQYLLKDPPQTLPNAKKKMQRLNFLHFFCKYALLFLASNVVWTFFFSKLLQYFGTSPNVKNCP